MYWTNIWQPTVHLQKNIFGKTIIEICSPHFYASFGTFHVQIGQLFTTQWVFKHSKEFRNRRHFPLMTANCRFSIILQILTVPQIIDRFGRRRSQKEPKGAKRCQKETKGDKRRQKEPKGAKRSQKEPKGAKRSQKEPKGAKRSQKCWQTKFVPNQT